MKLRMIKRLTAALLCVALLAGIPALAVFEDDALPAIPAAPEVDAVVELPEGAEEPSLISEGFEEQAQPMSAAVFDVTVPTTLSIHMDANGGITCGNIIITNNGTGSVVVEDAQVTALNGWTLVDYATTTFTDANKGQHKVALQLGSLDSAIAANGGQKTVGVAAKIPYQGTAISNAPIAQIVFVMGFPPPSISCDGTIYTTSYNDGVYTVDFMANPSVDPGRTVSIPVNPASDWTGWSWTLTVSKSGNSKVISSGEGNPSETTWHQGVEVGWDFYGDSVSVTFEAVKIFVWPETLTGSFSSGYDASDVVLKRVMDNIYQIMSPTGFDVKPYGVTLTITPPEGYKFVESMYNSLTLYGNNWSASALQQISFSIQEDGTLSVYEGHGGYAAELYNWSGTPTVALKRV